MGKLSMIIVQKYLPLCRRGPRMRPRLLTREESFTASRLLHSCRLLALLRTYPIPPAGSEMSKAIKAKPWKSENIFYMLSGKSGLSA